MSNQLSRYRAQVGKGSVVAGAQARAGRVRADTELAERIAESTRNRTQKAGRLVNHKRVERVMRKFHIVGLSLRKKVRTTIPEPSAAPVADLLRRDFTATMPNSKYVGDVSPDRERPIPNSSI